MKDIEVAVVGAGPHGLSAAIHMKRAGVDARVFGEPMSFWRTMPEGMKLRSNMSATNMVEPVGPLSLKAFMAETGQQITYPVPLSTFIEYGQWVQRNGVPDVDQRTVTTVNRHRDGFDVELADGERLSAERVVVAGGIAPFAYTPAGFGHLPSQLISHTGQHPDLSVFAGQRVAVVGGGQSAFESAALMQERGATAEVLVRSPAIVWLRSQSPKNFMGPMGDIVYAPTDVGPAWYSRLVANPDVFRRLPRAAQNRIAYRSIRPACSHFVRVRLDDVKVTLGVRVNAARRNGSSLQLTLSDGTDRHIDHLMFGTGYRIDVARYGFLSPGVVDGLRRANGYPLLRRGLESSVPGLHFVGAPAQWSFGPILRFVSGSWYAGSAVAREVARRSPVLQPAMT